MDKITKLCRKSQKETWGGVDTNRAGWYFIKKTGMVKFVENGKKGINNTADAETVVTDQERCDLNMPEKKHNREALAGKYNFR